MMKLKSLLALAFFALTLIPIIVISFLLYQSGFNLSTESYTRNLIESINVQEDYISQVIENNMISDYRFVSRNRALFSEDLTASHLQKSALLTALQAYLATSEDKIAVCLLLNKDNVPLYAIGENGMVSTISAQLPNLTELRSQIIMEFDLNNDVQSLGIITPVRNEDGVYLGSFISVYDKFYIFKIISSYHKIVDTSTFICRKNGAVITSRKFSDEKQNVAIEKALDALTLGQEGLIDTRIGTIPVSGYYKNIRKSPWYLVGFIDDELIYSFTNRFLWVYFFIIIGVLVADVVLSFYFSQKVVEPINALIKVMEGYRNNLADNVPEGDEKNSYFEIQYLRSKFSELMKTIMLVQHNFSGIYQLYQSNDMGDINIDIDVKKQTIHSNKAMFQELIDRSGVPEDKCVVEKFTRCFCEKDQILLMIMFEKMRDEHLSVASEAEIYTPQLNQKWFHTLVVPMYEDDRLSRLFIQLRDISSFKKQEIESREQARKDTLTGLYNRCGFAERVATVLHEKSKAALHGLLFIDMDFFKLVNDNLGHSKGDDLLRQVSQSLQDVVGPDGFVSRFGGDEFAVFLPQTTLEHIEQVKLNLRQRLVYPFRGDHFAFEVSASIGSAVWSSEAPRSLDELLHLADVDMYEVKRAFKQGETR